MDHEPAHALISIVVLVVTDRGPAIFFIPSCSLTGRGYSTMCFDMIATFATVKND